MTQIKGNVVVNGNIKLQGNEGKNETKHDISFDILGSIGLFTASRHVTW